MEPSHRHDDTSMDLDDPDVNFTTHDDTEATRYSKSQMKCIFCNKFYKRYNNRIIKLSCTKNYSTFDSIKTYATQWNDFCLLKSINDIISDDSEITYHKNCKMSYNINSSTKNNPQTEWHATRDHYKASFEKLCFFIDQFIIQDKQFCYLNFALDLYKEFLVESYNDKNVEKDIFCTRKIPAKSLKHFKNQIKIIVKPNVAKYIVPIDCDLIISKDGISANGVILRAAMILRNEVRDLHRKPIEDNVTVSDLIAGECSIPPYLSSFYTTLIAGFNYRRRKNTHTARLANSFGSDIIYTVSNGLIKPSKQITLASTVKSMTNSKKLLKILHKFGHICSYETIQSLETEATYSLTDVSL